MIIGDQEIHESVDVLKHKADFSIQILAFEYLTNDRHEFCHALHLRRNVEELCPVFYRKRRHPSRDVHHLDLQTNRAPLRRRTAG